MAKRMSGYLSKREQQIMELVYERERLTAGELETLLPGGPSNSTVRTLLRILEEKGHLRHETEEGRFVYFPTRPRQAEARSALKGIVQTFFGGSVPEAVATLLSGEGARMTDEELAELQALIERAREEGR